jgi:acetyl coenzyme A synthetase (ADP forming)-like protein
VSLPPDGPRAAQSLRAFFEPRTVAVIGVGRNRGGVGAEIFHNLISGGFRGTAIPINPHAQAVESVRAYPTVRDVACAIDLAIVAVPADRVDGVLDECIAAHIPAVILISAGFSETGERGRLREQALRDKVRGAGLRLIGPNCMGLVNTDPAFHLNASFSPAFPPEGRIAFSSQSGALGLAVLEHARQLGLGISSFVSIGNKADVSANDLLEYWEGDARTAVILLYVESFGNPRRFARIARRVSRQKPIVALKAGRSRSGARAASSHTGALAAKDTIVDALFREAGVIRTETMEELFDVAALLSGQPLPGGARVGILTNAGGPGILAADACEAHGLSVPPLSSATIDALRTFLPDAASLANPVDMLATAPAEHYRRAIPILLADTAIDSLLTIFIPPLVTDTADAAHAIADAARASAKPVLATFFGASDVRDILAGIPCYTFPESAARALAQAVAYAGWRGRPAGSDPARPRFDEAAARALVSWRASSGGGWLSPLECALLLRCCGIPAPDTRAVLSREGALGAAQQLGYPVALKGSGARLLHKTEAGVVFTNLRDETALRQAFSALETQPDVEQLLVQPMVGPGVEMIVGASRDPAFGPVIVCGSGGTQVEIWRDTSCRLAPLTDQSAREMLDETRGVALLRGFRGAPPCDEAALRDIVVRVSALITACPEIEELDLNPVIVTTAGAWAVDVRVRVGPGQKGTP